MAILVDMRSGELEAAAARVCTLLKAMSNDRRLMILCHLAEGEKSVGELERRVGLSQSALSQHLARLRRDRFVRTRRNAQTIYYSLDSHEVLVLMRVLYDLYCRPAEGHGGPLPLAIAADAAKD